jgi:Peptidase family M23
MGAVLATACTTGANVDGTSPWDPAGGPGGGMETASGTDDSSGSASEATSSSVAGPEGDTSETTPEPPTTTTGDTGEPQDCAFVRAVGLGGDPLNVRSEPDLAGVIVGMLSSNQVVAVVSEAQGDLVTDPVLGNTDLWYEIDGAGVQGFVTALYTECTEEPEAPQWVWPVPLHHAIAQDYGNPIQYQSCGFHTGLDIGGSIGDPVVAAADGVVVHVGPLWFSGAGQGRGPYAIVLQHGDGPLYSTYGHNDAALVTVGDEVAAGDPIADLGTLGYSSGPHLHFEILEGTPFTGEWQLPFDDACDHYRDPKDHVQP